MKLSEVEEGKTKAIKAQSFVTTIIGDQQLLTGSSGPKAIGEIGEEFFFIEGHPG